MSTSLVDAESILALDIGSIHTRAVLIDVVDGQYRFIGQSEAPTTVAAPYFDLSEGVYLAVRSLQEVVGRDLLDVNHHVILPASINGAGVDRLVTTYSVGSELKVVITGLLDEVSIESAQHLVGTTYARVAEVIGLNDRRRAEAQLDAILRAQPNLIVLVGGTENGASRSVYKLAELIILLCRLLPQEERPEVLYAGNSALSKRISENLQKYLPVRVAPNIRPSIDVEDLGPAREVLSGLVTSIREKQIPGLEGLVQQSSTPPLPTASALGRMVAFLSKVYAPSKGVMGVDVGSRSTILASAVMGDLSLNIFPYGQGSGLHTLLQQSDLNQIMRWLPMHIAPDVVRDYLEQKALFPSTLPLTSETLAIEQAATRQILNLCVQQMRSSWPNMSKVHEPILASGVALTHAISPAQSMLMLLDGLQPPGVSTLVLDQNGLLPALGVASAINQIMPVQVLESGAFVNLGTVISPVCTARYGTTIMRVRIEYEEGGENRLEIRQGSLTVLPVQPGQSAYLHFQPLRELDMMSHRSRSVEGLKVVGGVCGAVIDARGRPVDLPVDDARRRDLLKKWAAALGV